jgi:hypothetical protein
MMSKARENAEAMVDRLEQMFLKVERMRRRGNLDRLLLEQIEGFAQELYERGTRHRHETQAAAKAAFPPCGGVSALRGSDASASAQVPDDPDIEGGDHL